MTKEFQYLMALVGHAAQGKMPHLPNEALDWKKLFQLSREQSLQHLMAYALKMNLDIPCPDALRASATVIARDAAIVNMMRSERIALLLQALEQNGIHAVLLKGNVVADEYATPAFRISGDTDIWVSPEEEKQACALLEAQGFHVEQRWKKGHHAVCNHPQMGCVELHVVLYEEIVEEVWFGKKDACGLVREEHLRKTNQSGTYYTLGITDHLIFLTLHMIKHLISRGMSLRMMLDVALYMKNHVQDADLIRYWSTLHELHFGKYTTSRTTSGSILLLPS